MAQITLNSSGVASNGSLLLQSNGTTTAVTIDASQNVGLGVTPSAWGALKAVEFAGGTSVASDGTAIQLTSNAYYNGSNWIYKNSAGVGNYYINNNTHVWRIAASGTAGNTISFTQAMTLDASGNLGLGTTSPSAIGALYTTIDIRGTSGGGLRLGSTATSGGLIYGNAGGLTYQTEAALAHTFYVNNVEAARIDSSGNLLVGTNSTLGASGVLQLLGSMDAQAVTRCSAASAGQYWRYGADSGNSFIVYSSNASGGVYIGNASTSWTGRSDERLKDIIEPITNATNKVSSLRAVIGKFKTDEEGTRRSFLIAQDVQAVLPEAVSVSPRKEGEDTDYLGVAYTDVIPLLVAAIKEQQAIITQLQADVAALKGTA